MVLLHGEALPRRQVQKYFPPYPDATAIAEDAPGALAKLCEVFARNKVNLTYLRTHCQPWQKGFPRQYRLEISYQQEDHFNFDSAKWQL
jgi:prephenate dehydratase